MMISIFVLCLSLLGFSVGYAVPVVSSSIRYANSSNEYVEMKNGDISKKNFGSVTQELTDLGVQNLSLYETGQIKGSKGFGFSETSSNVYFYTYDESSRTSFDFINADFQGDVDVSNGSLEFDPNLSKTYSIELVSYSSSKRLCKWQIKGVENDLSSSHVYYVRQLFDSSNKDSLDGVLSCVLAYQFDGSTKKSLVTYMDSVTVTEKVVAWQLLPTGNVNEAGVMNQYHYVAFSTDKDDVLNDLVEVEISYKSREFIGYDESLKCKDNSEGLMNSVSSFNLKNLSHKTILKDDGIDNVVRVKPETKTTSAYSGFWFWRNDVTWTIDSISKVSEFKKNHSDDLIYTQDNSDVMNKTWIVNFLDDTFSVGFNSSSYSAHIGLTKLNVTDVSDYLLIGSKGTSYNFYYDVNDYSDFINGNLNDYDAVTDVYDCSILRLWYQTDSGVKQFISVDTYNESKGTDNIINPEVNDKDFSWLFNILIGVVSAVILVVLIVVFPPVLKGLIFLIKFVIVLIYFPFWLLYSFICLLSKKKVPSLWFWKK
jgi:hypothetical protein